MAEYWDMFFKAAEPKQRESGTVVLSTTTDSQQELNSAAEGKLRHDELDSGFTFTSQGPSLVLPDGSIEHGEMEVQTGRPAPKGKPADRFDLVAGLSPAQIAAAQSVYESAVLATEAIYPDFQEVLANTKEQLPNAVLRYIVAAIPNGPAVARHLALHPSECQKIRDLEKRGFTTQAQRYVERLGDQLATDASVGMDADSYRLYCQKRNYQIRSRV